MLWSMYEGEWDLSGGQTANRRNSSKVSVKMEYEAGPVEAKVKGFGSTIDPFVADEDG